MKIYFAGSIGAGRQDAPIYAQLIAYLKRYGVVLTEHVGDISLTEAGEKRISDTEIHDRDLEWLLESDAVVAEITVPSLGVGYELGRAVEWRKDILCLYRPAEGRRVSGMIKGCSKITTKRYADMDGAQTIIDGFFQNLLLHGHTHH